jgi:ArsR family transcriptional regulator, lead/cadmium/zinc/bismuth-responsive transcriptional repressor
MNHTAKSLLKDSQRLEDLAETFKILADPTRLKIAVALQHNDLCVQEIAELIGMSESAVSHQLRLLRSLRLVKHEREGKTVRYSLDDQHIEQLIEVATEHVAER